MGYWVVGDRRLWKYNFRHYFSKRVTTCEHRNIFCVISWVHMEMPCPRRVDICCWNSHRHWAQAPSCCSRWHSNEPPSSSVVVLTPFHLGRSTMSVFGIIIILGLDIFRTMGLIWGKFSWACQESWQREALETEQLCEIWPVWWVCVCVSNGTLVLICPFIVSHQQHELLLLVTLFLLSLSLPRSRASSWQFPTLAVYNQMYCSLMRDKKKKKEWHVGNW